jgi:hypothetical protein
MIVGLKLPDAIVVASFSLTIITLCNHLAAYSNDTEKRGQLCENGPDRELV